MHGNSIKTLIFLKFCEDLQVIEEIFFNTFIQTVKTFKMRSVKYMRNKLM